MIRTIYSLIAVALALESADYNNNFINLSSEETLQQVKQQGLTLVKVVPTNIQVKEVLGTGYTWMY